MQYSASVCTIDGGARDVPWTVALTVVWAMNCPDTVMEQVYMPTSVVFRDVMVSTDW